MNRLWTLAFAVLLGFSLVACNDREAEPEGGMAPVAPDVDVEPVVPEGDLREPARPASPELKQPAGEAVAPDTDAGGATVREEPVTYPPPELKEEAKKE